MASIDQAKIRKLAAAGKTDGEIAEIIGCRIETLHTIARRKHIEIPGYNPARRGAAEVKYLPTDAEIEKNCHEFAVSLGIVNPVTTRRATPEELAELDNLKPEPKNLYYQKWSDV